jgi:hypothetical protein
LAQVFAKTGTNRQALLVKLMMQVVGLSLDASGDARGDA